MTVRLQIGDALRRRIASGELPAQSPIPSERTLAEELGVSRMTVRAAVAELVEEGLLIRRHGRSTLVASGAAPVSALDCTPQAAPDPLTGKINRAAGFTSFSEEMRLRGWQPRSEVRRAATILADVAIAAQLTIPVGSRVILVERLRFADDEPLAHEFVHLPHSRFPDLLTQDLAHCSLYDLLESHYGVRPIYAEESVEAVLMSAAEAALFSLDPGAPALLTRRITRAAGDTVVEAATTLYRGDRYRMVLARSR
jgi:GntR family transcriptional regulator